LLSFSVSITRGALLFGVAALLLAGCGEREANGDRGPAEREHRREAPGTGGEDRAGGGLDPASGDRVGRILVIGTSLTAGPGIAPEATYPARLQERIDSVGLPYRVVNAGVSGETSAGALRRLDWLLREPVDVVILETGANDMLRGLDPDTTRANLDRILDRLARADPSPRILVVPMRAMPNLGREYARRFEALYPEVAERHGARLTPFLLEDVAADPDMNLADGIHPNERGHERMARTLWATLLEELHQAAEHFRH
jgi:acyl-CoA thioesterase I